MCALLLQSSKTEKKESNVSGTVITGSKFTEKKILMSTRTPEDNTIKNYGCICRVAGAAERTGAERSYYQLRNVCLSVRLYEKKKSFPIAQTFVIYSSSSSLGATNSFFECSGFLNI